VVNLTLVASSQGAQQLQFGRVASSQGAQQLQFGRVASSRGAQQLQFSSGSKEPGRTTVANSTSHFEIHFLINSTDRR